MRRPILAVDLGVAWAALVVRQGSFGPEVCAVRHGKKWDDVQVEGELRFLIGAWKPSHLACEKTFVGKFARAVLSQADKRAQMRGIARRAGIIFLDVPPQGAKAAAAAGGALQGSFREIGEGTAWKLEHVRDCAAIALCALGRAREGKEKV